MRKLSTLLIGWLVIPVILLAAPQFPVLTDRVVDTAGILTPAQTSALIAKLKAHEQKTSNQIVVVTLKDLGGYDIADYGYQLGRHWKIGQKEKNNGVLLIVSQGDRKVRLEVGYGLEGALPDARAHDIIQSKIITAFKQQNFYKGINQGVDSIIASILGEYKASSSKSSSSFSSSYLIFTFLFMVSILSHVFSETMNRKNGVKRLMISLTSSGVVGIISWIILHMIYLSLMLAVIVFLVTFFFDSKKSSGFDYGGSSWSSGSSSSGGGFSGFGGSFGGGGASGSW